MTDDSSIDTDRMNSNERSDNEGHRENSSLSIDSSRIPKSPEHDLESRIERGSPDQFNTRYAPAQKFLAAEYVMNKNKSKATAFTYDSRLRLFVDYLAESRDITPESAKEEDVRGFLWFMGSQYNRALNTLSCHKSTISQLYRFLQTKDQFPDPEVTTAVVDTIDESKYVNEELKFERESLSREEVIAMIETAHSPRNQLICQSMYEMGVRNDDLAELKIPNVNTEDLCVQVNDSKGGKDYRIPIRKEIALKIDYYIRTKREAPENSDYLFPSEQGGRLSNSRVGQIIKNIADEAEGVEQKVIATIENTPNQEVHFGGQRKIKRVTPHIFRHSIVTHLSEKDLPHDLLKLLTGHDSDAIKGYDHSEHTTAFDIIRQSL